jgi:hypothetical protein
MADGTNDKQKDLAPFLTRALQDLFSQAGRIAPDVTTVRELLITAFSGGIIDDEKYTVSANNISSNIYYSNVIV